MRVAHGGDVHPRGQLASPVVFDDVRALGTADKKTCEQALYDLLALVGSDDRCERGADHRQQLPAKRRDRGCVTQRTGAGDVQVVAAQELDGFAGGPLEAEALREVGHERIIRHMNVGPGVPGAVDDPPKLHIEVTDAS